MFAQFDRKIKIYTIEQEPDGRGGSTEKKSLHAEVWGAFFAYLPGRDSLDSRDMQMTDSEDGTVYIRNDLSLTIDLSVLLEIDDQEYETTGVFNPPRSPYAVINVKRRD